MTDPQTAADAAERVQAFVAARPQDDREGGHIVYTVPDPDRTRGRWLHLTEPDLRALLADRVRMAAELEQVRGDWLTQAAQLNRIAGMVGHALILRACDDATPEEVRLALARACEDVHGVIGESEATRAQRTERYLVMCANLLNDHVLRERDGLAERNEEMRDALTVAAELIDRLAFDEDPCEIDHNGYCQTHNLHSEPCPYPLGRRFVEAWRAVQADPASPDVTTAPQSAP